MSNAQSLAKLRALRERIASLPEVAQKIAKRAAVEFSKLAREDFDAQRSPDGEAWTSGKDGKTVTLKKSGTLEDKATKYTATGRRVRASVTGVRYARYQRPARFIPRGLPPEWADRLREIAREEIDAHLRGSR